MEDFFQKCMVPLLGSFLMIFSSCSTQPISSVDAHLQVIRHTAKPLHSKQAFTQAETSYLAHYDLEQAADIEHHFGYLGQDQGKVAVHWFESPKASRIVVVCHGYFDHTGTWKHAIPALLDAGNSVLIYDHPGHGLSEGEPAFINDFRDYVVVLEKVLDYCRRHTDLPIVLAGHSMGCAVISDYILERQRKESHAVFIAPLIRTAGWRASKISHAFFGRLFPTVPRVFRKNSSDRAYLEFVKADPLHCRRVPLAWTKALIDWNKRSESFAPREDCQVRILQGARDSTVNWKFNLAFLKSKLPQSSVFMFPEGQHQLLNEAQPLLADVLKELVSAVDEFPALE